MGTRYLREASHQMHRLSQSGILARLRRCRLRAPIGRRILGVYPLLPDDTTRFIAADFDGSTWRDDAIAYAASCRDLSTPAYVEVSRSGDGAHVWTFFDSPIA